MSNTEQTSVTNGTESEPTQEVDQPNTEVPAENTDAEQPEGEQETDKDSDLPEWAQKELTRVRSEAADRRVQLREAQEALSKAKTPEEYEAAVQEFTTKIESLERQILVDSVARQFDLPPELAVRLSGGTEEELKADAKLLAKFAGTEEPESLGGGLNPTGSSSETFDPVAASRKARTSRY